MPSSVSGVSQIPGSIDRLLASLLLLLLAPVMAGIALAVRLEGRGPVLYREPRIGREGRRIRVVKFRSLRTENAGGRRVVPPDDPRITRIGRLLRRAHLDELPQLVAVARGDMSLVGPRPERPDAWDTLEPSLRQRALPLRPGLTSPAGLRYLCEDTVLAEYSDPDRLYREVLLPTKLREDLHYLETRTLVTDLKLLAATVRHAWLARGGDARCRERVRALLAAHGATRSAATQEVRRA